MFKCRDKEEKDRRSWGMFVPKPTLLRVSLEDLQF